MQTGYQDIAQERGAEPMNRISFTLDDEKKIETRDGAKVYGKFQRVHSAPTTPPPLYVQYKPDFLSVYHFDKIKSTLKS